MSPALTLWSLADLTLVSSVYAIDEAERNLDTADTRARLYRLIQRLVNSARDQRRRRLAPRRGKFVHGRFMLTRANSFGRRASTIEAVRFHLRHSALL